VSLSDEGRAGWERNTLTKDRIAVVQKALQVYVIQHSCLPCPADGSLASSSANAGHALAGGATYVTSSVFCTATACSATTSAVVPWRDLGLSEEDVTDGWNDRIRYAVGGTSGTSCAAAVAVTATSGMRACGTGGAGSNPVGSLTLNDLDNVANPTTGLVYVLASNGSDHAFGLATLTGLSQPDRWAQNPMGGTTNQYENANGDSTFLAGSTNTLNGTHALRRHRAGHDGLDHHLQMRRRCLWESELSIFARICRTPVRQSPALAGCHGGDRRGERRNHRRRALQ
jgi:hypothetical protein